MNRRVVSLILVLAWPALRPVSADSRVASTRPVEDFAFVHVSDVHVEAHLQRSGEPGPVRGAETIDWICRESPGPQTISVFGLTSEAPAFGIVTGDLTEYGVIDDTWAVFERAFASLPYPLYVIPGNHDNTWVAMYSVMRQRHGGENYSFDKFGCHFACISSASPQEPVPTIDGKTRAWLERDLKSIPAGTPVFLALHHPPDSNEFANPAEYDTLIDRLRDYNVVLILYGHGHSVVHKKFDGIDGVMGGSTFGKNAGYGVISVEDGTLRAAYRSQPGANGRPAGKRSWKTLLEKPLAHRVPERLFRIVRPDEGSRMEGRHLDVVLQTTAKSAESVQWTFHVDGDVVPARAIDEPAGNPWRIDLSRLTPGAHLLSVRATTASGEQDVRTRTVITEGDNVRCVWRTKFPAAIKAAPVVVGENVIVARTDGVITAINRSRGEPAWSFATGAEILGTPAWSGETLVVGSGDGHVYALDANGRVLWRTEVGSAVYGAPLIDEERVFVGDNGGRLHALNVRDGNRLWTFERADYAIECQPCRWGSRILFGAWDGYLYAVDRDDGKLAWKVMGPKSSEGKAARYYAPADCGPVALDDRLFVCDRGYRLGMYSEDGSLRPEVSEEVAAIALDAQDRRLLVRGKNDRVRAIGAEGDATWETTVQTGRFPAPPTIVQDCIYVCSDRGLLSALDRRDGKLQWSYQVTPGFYVMAPVTASPDGACYAAGMDGTVVALHAGSPTIEKPAPSSGTPAGS